MYERLLYVSRVRGTATPQLLYDLVRVAHNRNSQFGISGALLLLDGHYIQVLEGDAFRVRERFAVICRDRRHHRIELRQHVACRELLFGGEWLALCSDADVPASLREGFGYQPGLPASRFDAARVIAFVQACCALQQQASSPLQPA